MLRESRETRVPEASTGRRVEADIMKTNALAGSPMPGSLTAWEGRGELHGAGPYGIEASLLFAYEQPDSRPDRLSHPWTAVLSMRLAPR